MDNSSDIKLEHWFSFMGIDFYVPECGKSESQTLYRAMFAQFMLEHAGFMIESKDKSKPQSNTGRQETS